MEIVDVAELVHEYPEGAMNCYGPCPGYEEDIEAENQRQAARLLELVAVAEDAVSVDANVYGCDVEDIDENLDALADLNIVEVFGLVEAVPENNPNCYNTPCPEDVAEAEQVTCQRASALAHIVAETTEL